MNYGFLNKNDKMNPDIEYRLVVGNVIWSIILCETIIAPVLLLGWHMYEPVGKLDKNKKSSPFKGAKGGYIPPKTNRGFQIKIEY